MGGDHNESVVHYMLFGIIITNPDILLNSNQQYGENCISLSVHDINDFTYLAPKHSLQYVSESGSLLFDSVLLISKWWQ